jgi:proteasome lid subunit RPN8/RPN11
MNLLARLHRKSNEEKRKEAISRQCALLGASYETGMIKALRRFNRFLRKADSDGTIAAAKRIRTLCTLSKEVNALVSSYLLESPPFRKTEEHRLLPSQFPADIPIYFISSMVLHECYRYLMQKKPGANEEPEWMLAVTGVRIGSFLTLEHWLEFKLSLQSPAQAAADMTDFTKLMLKLDEFGQALHGIFHSHRFNGPPRPSGTDLHLQETLEQASYLAIQAIFSQDGYVRFFARDRPFEVLIYGREVQRHERFLYRLNQIGEVSHS